MEFELNNVQGPRLVAAQRAWDEAKRYEDATLVGWFEEQYWHTVDAISAELGKAGQRPVIETTPRGITFTYGS